MGSPSPAQLASAMGAPQLQPPQLALLLCEGHSLASWWTLPSGKSGGLSRPMEDLLTRLPYWCGTRLRELLGASRTLPERGIYHSATSLLKDALIASGSIDSIPRRSQLQTGVADWHAGLCASVGPTTALQVLHATSAMPPGRRIALHKTGDALEQHCQDIWARAVVVSDLHHRGPSQLLCVTFLKHTPTTATMLHTLFQDCWV